MRIFVFNKSNILNNILNNSLNNELIYEYIISLLFVRNKINKILISKINKKIKNPLINEENYLVYKFYYIKNNELSI